MKLGVIGFLFIAMFSYAHAATPFLEPPLAGTYSYQGSFAALSRWRVEQLDTLTPGGQARLEELRRAGYECASAERAIFQCKASLSPEGSSKILRAPVAEALYGKKLVLGAANRFPATEPSPSAESVTWRVHQRASYDGNFYDSYRLVFTQGEWTARFGLEGTPTYTQFSASFASDLSKVLKITIEESETAFSNYTVAADFRRM